MTSASAPAPHQVDIWLTRLDGLNDSARALYMKVLDASELERLNRFLMPDARDQFLVARALLRTVPSQYAEVRCEE